MLILCDIFSVCETWKSVEGRRESCEVFVDHMLGHKDVNEFLCAWLPNGPDLKNLHFFFFGNQLIIGSGSIKSGL